MSARAATAQASRPTVPAKTRVVRGPSASDSQPSNGAPAIPDTALTMDIADSTRPRMSSLVSSCTRADTVVSMTTAADAIGTSSPAKIVRFGASPASSCSPLASSPAPISSRWVNRPRCAASSAPTTVPPAKTAESSPYPPAPPCSGPALIAAMVTW